ncbi:hypothetical protein [Rubrivivax gelatinosus]|uniref:Uncharacterized protein n=1 Tax=Rubrivivax gelatinosus (strain NBRC 100245 / IL144) TaxID=983917 RepID=I0HPP6_RUBGI|nr:hypothetical protein [Rubrivivax gelatinosus]BAL94983.1 hypothetical protein RGE_16420 [Rubrivivax gelatinosus IL144]
MKKKRPNDRPVRDWFGMGIALVQLITAIVNAVFNYQLANAREVAAQV